MFLRWVAKPGRVAFIWGKNCEQHEILEHLLMDIGIGDILQKAESNGIPEEPNTGEAEGRGCAGDAGTNRPWRTRTEAMNLVELERNLYNRHEHTA